MRRAGGIRAAGYWPRSEAVASITLAAADRHRRRVVLVDDAGEAFLLDLPKAAQMRDGDGLELAGGGFVRVAAAAEEVMDVVCRDPEQLARIAWHVGNRHAAVQVLEGGGLRIAADHVLATMLEGMGVEVRRHRAPFQPEPGAYDPHGLTEAPLPLVRRA